jgi:GTPase SAR1 family protein
VNLEALKSYYERLQEAAAVNTTLKLLLVGLGTAGKTSMANRLRGVKCAETQVI